MKIKQIVAGIGLGAVLTLSLPILAATTTMAQATGTQLTGFTDVSVTSPYYTAINGLRSMGIVSGYADGTFKPDQIVNRVEALKIILLGAAVSIDNSSGTGGFKDTDANAWYAKYLLKAKSLGIVNGYPDKTFKPDQTVTLAEGIKMVINAMKMDISKVTVSSNPYADAFKNQWYAPYIQWAKDHQWLSADSKNMVYPGTGMTRAKLAQLLWNAMNTYQSTTPVTPATPTQQQTQQTTQQTQESVVQPSNQPIWNTTDAMIINIETTGFVKNSMTIAQGAKVLWINKSSLPEDVTSNDGSFSSGTLQPGQSFMYTFNNLGTFNYYSSKNTSLTGTIIVKLPIEVPTI